MNLISWALEFQNQWRQHHLDETCTLQTATAVYKNIRGTKIDPDSRTNNQGVRRPTDTVLWMFPKASVPNEIPRGSLIITSYAVYEVIIDNNVKDYFDDSEQRTVVINAKIKSTS